MNYESWPETIANKLLDEYEIGHSIGAWIGPVDFENADSSDIAAKIRQVIASLLSDSVA